MRQIEREVVEWHKGYEGKPVVGDGTWFAPEAGLAVEPGVEPEAEVEPGVEKHAPYAAGVPLELSEEVGQHMARHIAAEVVEDLTRATAEWAALEKQQVISH